ncbi:MAG: HIT family protein [Lachnospiraceae bacterium]|nr:HIT family protein [Lachnospiraceae bacterium]
MADCIFCKIAAGEIPSTTLYEDADVRVIFDIAPASLGHAVILPKTHAANVFELPDETLQKAALVAKKVGAAMVEAFHSDGLNVLQNNGEAAGQTVFHYHVHLIPRYHDDGVGITWKQGSADGALLKEKADLIARLVK